MMCAHLGNVCLHSVWLNIEIRWNKCISGRCMHTHTCRHHICTVFAFVRSSICTDKRYKRILNVHVLLLTWIDVHIIIRAGVCIDRQIDSQTHTQTDRQKDGRVESELETEAGRYMHHTPKDILYTCIQIHAYIQAYWKNTHTHIWIQEECVSIYLSICMSVCLSIYLSNLSIYLSNYLIYLINQSINLSINQSIYLSIYLIIWSISSINQSIYLSNYLIYLIYLINQSIYLSI